MTENLDRPFAIPSWTQRSRELLVARELPRVLLSVPSLVRAPHGDGRILLTIPGFGAGDASLLPIRRFLSARQHDTRGWGLGRNTGDAELLLDKSLRVAQRLAHDSGKPVNLVGWSLGGVIAREIARDQPDIVHRIATIGTPLTGPRHTVASRSYSPEQLDHIDAIIEQRRPRPIQRPVLAVYSRNDGVVDWRTCIDNDTEGLNHHRSSSTHIGMGIDPDVWIQLAHWFATSNTMPVPPA